MNKPIDIITKTDRELGLRVLRKQAEYSSHAYFASTRIFLLPKGPNVLPILLHTITDKRQSRCLGYLYKDKNRRYLYYAWNPMSRQNPSRDTVKTFFLSTSRKKAHYALSSAPLDFLAYREVLIEDKSIVRDAHEEFFLASAFQDHVSTPDLSYNDNAEGGGTYQESCPLGVLELRTSMHLTSICALGSSWSWNLRHLIVVYSGG